MNTPRRRYAVTAEEMRALDASAAADFGIPSLLLMENAGRAVFEAALEMMGGVNRKRVIVVCGPGNNGGDGFVVARHLHNAGAHVTIAYYGDRAKAKGDALTNIQICEKMNLDICPRLPREKLTRAGQGADLIIDALLGTGIKGEIREPYAGVISAINEGSPTPILAVDIPSGIDADIGAVLGEAVRADTTVTFALSKIGLVTYPGALHVGRLRVADISIPDEAIERKGIDVWLPDAASVAHLFERRPDANKGDFGHVAIIAGSVGMTGAAALAAEGALRIGTGLVTLAVPESLNDILEVKLTEAMTICVPECDARAFGVGSLGKVLGIIEKRDAVVIGPGLGRNDETVSFTLELITRLNRPAVVDADALYALSTDLGVLKECESPVVITPHPGEMARLIGTTTAEVQSNRLETARAFARDHGVIVVLKGAATLVATPEGKAAINTTGGPGMASGGTGDVLSGMIGGLLASGRQPVDAACAAVYLHGRAGELAAVTLGEEAMLASDLAASIGEAICEVREEFGASQRGVMCH